MTRLAPKTRWMMIESRASIEGTMVPYRNLLRVQFLDTDEYPTIEAALAGIMFAEYREPISSEAKCLYIVEVPA